MTKKDTTPTLVDMKLAVINYHKGDHNEYLRTGIARDACYTSFNSMDWKSGQMSDLRAELSDLANAAGSEVVDVKIEKKIALYQNMEAELEELMERHTADCDVYHAVTGERWTRKPKRTFSSKGLGVDTELKRILA